MRPERLSDIIGSVYDCVLQPQEWSRTLPLISAFGESAASSMVVQGRVSNSGARVFEDGDRQSFLRLYFEKLAASRMPAMKQVAFDHLGEVATMTMLAGEREPLNSDFYLKWVRPLGFRDVIGVLVLKSGKRVAWFSVARSDVQSRFTEADLRQMELLSPHICRALLISDALDLQSIVATRLAETVDHLSTGILLTEESGRIAYMNGSAEAILKDGNALKSKDGRLVAVRPHARDALSRALEAIGLLYGLTAAERNVLEHVAASHTPQETADRLGVSINTVKTHLQKIFAKTNTTRQADLVRLVARSTAPLKSKR